MVPLRDGVQLATDIYQLGGASHTPVLAVRTPHNQDGLVAGVDVFDILQAVQIGDTVVSQDVRGPYTSEGTFNPYAQETTNGIDVSPWRSL